jgi:hypothetical protein
MRSSPAHFAAPRQATRYTSAASRLHGGERVLQVLDTDSTHQGSARDGNEDPIHLRDRPWRSSSWLCHKCGIKGSLSLVMHLRGRWRRVVWRFQGPYRTNGSSRARDWLQLAVLALQPALQNRVLVCELHLICIEFAHSGACFESGRVNLQAQAHTGETSAVTCARRDSWRQHN